MWRWSLQWRRPLLDRELEVLDSLLSTLGLVTLKEGRPDKWWLEPEVEGKYSVNSAYHFLQGTSDEERILVFSNLWQCLAPSNVKAFGWRTLWGRLQTKENLKKRGIITEEELLACPFCANTEESMEHVLFPCPFAVQVWNAYNRWMGIITVLPHNTWVHLLQHGSLSWNKRQRMGA